MNNLNLKIEKNKFNAFCGYSGGGKSTILNLMLKLYEAKSGRILIGGIEIDQIKLASILELVGYVGQDSAVFDESIDQNVCTGLSSLKGGLSTEEFLELQKLSNSQDFWVIGNNDAIGLKGNKVSGGQRQRIAIARALARNKLQPSLLILDEATASLDGKNEEIIQKSIDDILKNKSCTLVVVAHRLSTIKNADVINVLIDGEVVERGSHEELIKIENGIYKGMLSV